MLASNQPYQRVDDGIGAGLLTGGIIGGGLAAGAIYGGSAGLDKLSQFDSSMVNKATDKFNNLKQPTEKQTDRAVKRLNHAAGRQAMYGAGMDLTDSLKGMSGRRKAASIAGASVIGSLLGGVGDGLNG